tara:strand:- start:235 stop:2544 length:2310 start_codon:yes stop_codon:yes gene_type:complete
MLRLRYASFDPLRDTVSIPAALMSANGSDHNWSDRSSPDPTLWIVQFHNTPTAASRNDIAAQQGQIVSYLPDNAYVVRIAPQRTAQLATIAEARWTGPYHPAFRIDPELIAAGAHHNEAATRFHLVVANKHTDKPTLIAKIEAIGGRVDDEHAGSLLLEATLTGAQLVRAAAANEVLWIDAVTATGMDMDNARIQGGANYIEAMGGYTGATVNAHVYEGIEATHPDFSGGATNVNSAGGAASHGHATAGILFGNGTSNAIVRGMAPDCGKFFTEFTTVTTSRWQVFQDLVNNHDVSHTTASWGNAPTPYYSAITAEADDLVFDHDLAWTQAHGNAPSGQARPQSWAKNVFSIGGVLHFDDSNPNNDACTTSSGPAADGRIKPTLVAYADSVGTSDLSGAAGFSPSNWFANFGGSSAAAPMVAGHNVLAIEMFTDEVTAGFGLLGNPLRTAGGTSHQNRPHFPTLKALMVASAAQYAMTAPNNNPRACQGWGFPDLRQLYDSRQQMFVVDETDVLQPGAVRAWQVDVAAAQPFLKACLNWNEPAGNPAAAASLINNLSLRVTSPSGQVYWGNHNLASSVWSLPGGSEDSVNSIESVFVQTPSAGPWIVEVLATAIVLDNHIETAAVDADYGLVVLGGTGTFATVAQLGIGCAGVTLTASDRPILGSTFDLQTDHAPTNTAFGLSILATSTLPQPINLGSIGMPGCTLYQPLDLLTPFAIVSGSGSTPLQLPSNPVFIGTVLRSQSATLTPGINPFGFAISNALVMTADVH